MGNASFLVGCRMLSDMETTSVGDPFVACMPSSIARVVMCLFGVHNRLGCDKHCFAEHGEKSSM